jgi:hypothetical protein
MVEIFHTQKFDAALPKDKDGKALFTVLGIQKAEMVWAWEMPNNDLRILVRSSISPSGFSASTGEDSIRLVIQYKSASGEWRACGKGPDAYTTRTKGWEQRLNKKILELFYNKIKPVTPGAVRNLKEGEFFSYSTKPASNGRPFVSMAGTDKESTFRWVG